MGRPVTVVVGPLASATATKISLSQKAAIAGTNYIVLNGAAGSFSANNICQSQTPGGAGALTLNGVGTAITANESQTWGNFNGAIDSRLLVAAGKTITANSTVATTIGAAVTSTRPSSRGPLTTLCQQARGFLL